MTHVLVVLLLRRRRRRSAASDGFYKSTENPRLLRVILLLVLLLIRLLLLSPRSCVSRGRRTSARIRLRPFRVSSESIRTLTASLHRHSVLPPSSRQRSRCFRPALPILELVQCIRGQRRA